MIPQCAIPDLQYIITSPFLADPAALSYSATHHSYSLITNILAQVFIPLTRLCRDSCGYCTFAQPPVPGRRCFMTLEEMLSVARLGAEAGCTEALFTLGVPLPITKCPSSL